MEERVRQLLFDVIRKIVKIREDTGIAVDIHLSVGYWVVDFYFYSNNGDIESTHTESVHLDSKDAEEELDEIYELLSSLSSAPKETEPFNNQLN